MAIIFGQNPKNIPQKNLVLLLDANDPSSYPGKGNMWYDLSKYGTHWLINPAAPKKDGNRRYMDFNGSFGIAKTANAEQFVVTGRDLNHVTYAVWTRVSTNTSDWRTLTRGYGNAADMMADHHVMIQNGGWTMGKYDNNTGGAMINTGLSQQSLPNYGTADWMLLFVRFSSTDPYLRFSWNDTPGIIRGSSSDARATHRFGFSCIGGYHNDNTTNPDVSSQWWGDIGWFGVWNRELSDAELMNIWNSTCSEYGYTPSADASTSAITFQDGSQQTVANYSQGGGELISISTFTGSGVWTKPAGCTKILVSVTGGGGGAAGYCESGGAGGYAEKWIDASNLSTVPVTVGGGGNSVGYYTSAGDGGTSSFGSYVSASGGYGANRNYSHTGGHGGVGSAGQINLYGGAGTGHANSHGYFPGGQGGGSFWGGSSVVHRPGVNQKMVNGAPGAGGPGSRTDDGGGGSSAYGEAGIVVIYNYK